MSESGIVFADRGGGIECSKQLVLQTRRLFPQILISFVGLRNVGCMLISGLDETTGQLLQSPVWTDRMGCAQYALGASERRVYK